LGEFEQVFTKHTSNYNSWIAKDYQRQNSYSLAMDLLTIQSTQITISWDTEHKMQHKIANDKVDWFY